MRLTLMRTMSSKSAMLSSVCRFFFARKTMSHGTPSTQWLTDDHIPPARSRTTGC